MPVENPIRDIEGKVYCSIACHFLTLQPRLQPYHYTEGNS